MAILMNHDHPVNCVRWNPLGTLFASASDDEKINLWSYKGRKHVTEFEREQSKGTESVLQDVAGGEDQGDAEHPPSDLQREDWRAIMTWTNHKKSKFDVLSDRTPGVLDLAWAPDNLHFASCGTDSKIIIFNVKE